MIVQPERFRKVAEKEDFPQIKDDPKTREKLKEYL